MKLTITVWMSLVFAILFSPVLLARKWEWSVENQFKPYHFFFAQKKPQVHQRIPHRYKIPVWVQNNFTRARGTIKYDAKNIALNEKFLSVNVSGKPYHSPLLEDELAKRNSGEYHLAYMSPFEVYPNQKFDYLFFMTLPPNNTQRQGHLSEFKGEVHHKPVFALKVDNGCQDTLKLLDVDEMMQNYRRLADLEKLGKQRDKKMFDKFYTGTVDETHRLEQELLGISFSPDVAIERISAQIPDLLQHSSASSKVLSTRKPSVSPGDSQLLEKISRFPAPIRPNQWEDLSSFGSARSILHDSSGLKPFNDHQKHYWTKRSNEQDLKPPKVSRLEEEEEEMFQIDVEPNSPMVAKGDQLAEGVKQAVQPTVNAANELSRGLDASKLGQKGMPVPMRLNNHRTGWNFNQAGYVRSSSGDASTIRESPSFKLGTFSEEYDRSREQTKLSLQSPPFDLKMYSSPMSPGLSSPNTILGRSKSFHYAQAAKQKEALLAINNTPRETRPDISPDALEMIREASRNFFNVSMANSEKFYKVVKLCSDKPLLKSIRQALSRILYNLASKVQVSTVDRQIQARLWLLEDFQFNSHCYYRAFAVKPLTNADDLAVEEKFCSTLFQNMYKHETDLGHQITITVETVPRRLLDVESLSRWQRFVEWIEGLPDPGDAALLQRLHEDVKFTRKMKQIVNNFVARSWEYSMQTTEVGLQSRAMQARKELEDNRMDTASERATTDEQKMSSEEYIKALKLYGASTVKAMLSSVLYPFLTRYPSEFEFLDDLDELGRSESEKDMTGSSGQEENQERTNDAVDDNTMTPLKFKDKFYPKKNARSMSLGPRCFKGRKARLIECQPNGQCIDAPKFVVAELSYGIFGELIETWWLQKPREYMHEYASAEIPTFPKINVIAKLTALGVNREGFVDDGRREYDLRTVKEKNKPSWIKAKSYVKGTPLWAKKYVQVDSKRRIHAIYYEKFKSKFFFWIPRRFFIATGDSRYSIAHQLLNLFFIDEKLQEK